MNYLLFAVALTLATAALFFVRHIVKRQAHRRRLRAQLQIDREGILRQPSTPPPKVEIYIGRYVDSKLTDGVPLTEERFQEWRRVPMTDDVAIVAVMWSAEIPVQAWNLKPQAAVCESVAQMKLGILYAIGQQSRDLNGGHGDADFRRSRPMVTL